MKKKLGLLVLIAMIPLAGYFIALFVQSRFEAQWLNVVQRDLGARGEAAVKSGQLSLDRYCASSEGSRESACQTYQNVQLLQNASVASLIVGFGLLVAIVVAARLASANRGLLVALFSPGIKVVLFVLFALILVQGAIATYSIYVLEATLVSRVHFGIVALIGLGAVAGAITMINAGLSISRRATSLAVGKSVPREEQPRLWQFVSDLVQRLGAQSPRQVVIGLEPNFYVTSADVTVIPGGVTHQEETLYLSLPLMRILSRDELAAVIGHELGHFRGEDTKFSLKFYPIYAGTVQALVALESQKSQGASSLALLPGAAMLSMFLEEFAKAERTIGRQRELEADKAGASVASARAIATSLLKIGAFAPLWSSVRAAMVEAIEEGKAYTNASSFYAQIAASSSKPELVDEVAMQATTHPTDTHPPTGQRVEALGLRVSDLRDEALRIDPNLSSALLLDNLAELEEFLTGVEHRVLIEVGYATPPEASVDASGEQASKEVNEKLVPCPVCHAPISAGCPECPHCNALFGPSIDGKIGRVTPSGERAAAEVGLCSNCRSAIPVVSRECPHCNVLFGTGSDWKIEQRAKA